MSLLRLLPKSTPASLKLTPHIVSRLSQSNSISWNSRYSSSWTSLATTVAVSAAPTKASFSIHHTVNTSSLPTKSKEAAYDIFGPVDTVIKLREEPLTAPGNGEVLIQFIAAPINPADINMIEGVYNIKPDLPAIGGNEGVARVLRVGPGVTTLKAGDWVIPSQPGFGTWRDYAICDENDVDVVDLSSGVPIELAATISVNPCTAYRMLHDFATLKPGDVIIQNGANSSVGQCVIQLAKGMGVKTINIVRDRPNLAELTQRLTALGADVVVTEDQVASRNFASILEKFENAPVLGLNCVGGSSASEIARVLQDGSPLVTYGGMSRKPVAVPTGRLIFNDIKLHGFWLSRWTMTSTKQERQKMIQYLLQCIADGKLTTFTQLIPFSQFDHALATAKQGYRDAKIVLAIDESIIKKKE